MQLFYKNRTYFQISSKQIITYATSCLFQSIILSIKNKTLWRKWSKILSKDCGLSQRFAFCSELINKESIFTPYPPRCAIIYYSIHFIKQFTPQCLLFLDAAVWVLFYLIRLSTLIWVLVFFFTLKLVCYGKVYVATWTIAARNLLNGFACAVGQLHFVELFKHYALSQYITQT